jgi:hypothetical protein
VLEFGGSLSAVLDQLIEYGGQPRKNALPVTQFRLPKNAHGRIPG